MDSDPEQLSNNDIYSLRERLRALRHSIDDMEHLLNRAITSEQALRESEERFRLLVEQVEDYAIFMLDPTGHIVTWNIGAQRIKGYTAEEIIGQHFSRFYLPKAIAENKPAFALERATREGHYHEEAWRVRKDGTHFLANVLITALYDDKHQLRGFGKVTRDMTERKAAEEQREHLRASQLRLEREAEARTHMETMMLMRDELLATTAHELRTPVTSLLGYAQLLHRRAQRNDLQPERVLQSSRILIDQAHRLDRLTAMLLDLTRIEQGRLTLERQAIDVGTIVARIIDELQFLTEHHTLVINRPPQPLVILGDELRLEQMVYNLVQNAIKYSPGGGAITVDMRGTANDLLLTITDQGLGISEADLPCIFDRFYRATNVSSKHIHGVGIGLYIVQQLVTLHGGTIDVQSVVGQGSTFVVTLPLLCEQPPSASEL